MLLINANNHNDICMFFINTLQQTAAAAAAGAGVVRWGEMCTHLACIGGRKHSSP